MSADPTRDAELLALARAALEPGPTRASAALLDAIAADVHAHPRRRSPLRGLRRDPMPSTSGLFAGVPALTLFLVLLLALGGAAIVAGAVLRLRDAAPVTPHAIAGDLWLVTRSSDVQQLSVVDTGNLVVRPSALRCQPGGVRAGTPVCSDALISNAWSPDGSTLAFVLESASGTTGVEAGLWVFRDDDGAQVRIAGCELVRCEDGTTVAWIRGGSALAVSSAAGAGLVLVDPRTGVEVGRVAHPEPADDYWPRLSISPRGDHIAWWNTSPVSDGGGYFLGNLDGTGAVLLTDGDPQGISWSADGTTLAFGRVEFYGPSGAGATPRRYRYVVTVADARGGSQRDIWSLDGCCMGGGISIRPVLSPDGARIALHGHGDLYVIDVVAGTAQVVDSGTFTPWETPDWRP